MCKHVYNEVKNDAHQQLDVRVQGQSVPINSESVKYGFAFVLHQWKSRMWKKLWTLLKKISACRLKTFKETNVKMHYQRFN